MENKRRNFITRLAGISGFALMPSFVKAADSAVHVQNIRLSSQDGVTRLVFDLDAQVTHKLFTLHNPERVVLDLERSRLLNAGLLDDMRSGLLKGVRSGVRNVEDLRVVMDLSGKTQPSSFYLRPENGEGHRLVIELKDPNFKGPEKQQPMRDVIIAIDAGHGGNDPGASG
ncbi:MAG: AMIN domain-containing protein, partial [Gammaproteobacteria bacterium]|nr:AMIN domain-containing protein [Gammaproteobacteria bacterium]